MGKKAEKYDKAAEYIEGDYYEAKAMKKAEKYDKAAEYIEGDYYEAKAMKKAEKIAKYVEGEYYETKMEKKADKAEKYVKVYKAKKSKGAYYDREKLSLEETEMEDEPEE